MSGIKFNIGLTIDAFDRSLEKVKQSVGGLSDTLNSRLGRIIAFSAVVYSFKRLASSLNEIKDSSDRLGVTTETIQKIDYAAKISGTSLGAVEGAIRKIAKALYEVQSGGAGADKLTQTFKVLGLSFEDLKKSNINDIIFKISEQIQKISDPKLKLGILQQIGGRGAGQLMEFFNSLKSASEQLESRGGIIPDSAIKAADDLDDSFTSILTTIKAITAESGIFEKIASLVSGALQGLTEIKNPSPETKIDYTNMDTSRWGGVKEGLRYLGLLPGNNNEVPNLQPISKVEIKKVIEEKKQMTAAYVGLGTDKSIEKENKKAQSLNDEYTLLQAKIQLDERQYEWTKTVLETQKKIAEAKSEELKEAEKLVGAAKLELLEKTWKNEDENQKSKIEEIKNKNIDNSAWTGHAWRQVDAEAIIKSSLENNKTKTFQEKSLEYQQETAIAVKDLNRKQSNKSIYG